MPDSKFFEQGELNALHIVQDARSRDLNSHGTARAFYLLNNTISYLIGMHPLHTPGLSINPMGTLWLRYKRNRERWLANFDYWRHDN